tara:strand:- start:59 stop:265 length:207 start_codon:yes stop_codon:yes gene_type:complete
MSTHEIKASDLTWPSYQFTSELEARSHLRVIREELAEPDTTPERRADLQRYESQLEDLLLEHLYHVLF